MADATDQPPVRDSVRASSHSLQKIASFYTQVNPICLFLAQDLNYDAIFRTHHTQKNHSRRCRFDTRMDVKSINLTSPPEDQSIASSPLLRCIIAEIFLVGDGGGWGCTSSYSSSLKQYFQPEHLTCGARPVFDVFRSLKSHQRITRHPLWASPLQLRGAVISAN